MDGIVILTSVLVMISVCGLIFSPWTKMEPSKFSMIQDLSVVWLLKTGRDMIEFLHGQNIQDKICKIYYMRLYSGTHLNLMNGKAKESQDQKVWEFMKLTSAW